MQGQNNVANSDIYQNKVSMSLVSNELYQAGLTYLQDYENNPAWKMYKDVLGNVCYEKTDNGRAVQVKIDEIHGIKTVTINGNDNDKKNGLVGTDNQAVIKFMDSKSYDHIKTEDFIDRGKLIFAAARLVVEKSALSEKEKVNKASWINVQESNYVDTIINLHAIDPKIMRNQNSEIAKQHFNSRFKSVRKLQKQTLINMAAALDESDSSIGREKMLDKLKEAEKNYVLQKGRPVILKTMDIQQPDNVAAAVQAISIQIPLGKKTIPSSLRSGKDVAKVKLSNHVRDGSGIIKDNKIVISTVVDGHSSYPPIKEKDELIRRQVAIQAAEEKAKELLKEIIKQNPDPAQPLEIPLSTILLVTPFINKKFDQGLRKGESEHNQLADTRYALEYLQHTQPLKLSLDGSEYDVHVNTTCMSIPVNVGKKSQQILDDKLQGDINALGFQKYCENIQTKLNENKSSEFKTIVDEINSLFNHNANYAQAKQQLDQLVNHHEKNLQYLYKDLKRVLDHYAQAKANNHPDKDLYKQQYKILKSDIAHIQQLIDAQSQKVNDERKKIFDHNQQAILKHIAELQQLAEARPELKTDCNLQINFLKAQQFFFDKEFNHKNKAYQFQIIFLLTSEQSGQFIEAFCKSAEDRTGWLRVSLLANSTFNALYQRDPDLNNPEDKKIHDEILAHAYELSASLENTKYNSEARGLQISSQFTHETALYGNMNSRLAKTIYQGLDDMQPNVVYEKNSEYINVAEEKTRSYKNDIDYQRLCTKEEALINKLKNYHFVHEGNKPATAKRLNTVGNFLDRFNELDNSNDPQKYQKQIALIDECLSSSVMLGQRFKSTTNVMRTLLGLDPRVLANLNELRTTINKRHLFEMTGDRSTFAANDKTFSVKQMEKLALSAVKTGAQVIAAPVPTLLVAAAKHGRDVYTTFSVAKSQVKEAKKSEQAEEKTETSFRRNR